MKIYNLKPKAKVRYVGNSNSLRKGVDYIVESNFILDHEVFLKLESIDGKFPGEDFEGQIIIDEHSKIKRN